MCVDLDTENEKGFFFLNKFKPLEQACLCTDFNGLNGQKEDFMLIWLTSLCTDFNG